MRNTDTCTCTCKLITRCTIASAIIQGGSEKMSHLTKCNFSATIGVLQIKISGFMRQIFFKRPNNFGVIRPRLTSYDLINKNKTKQKASVQYSSSDHLTICRTETL